MDTPEKTVLLAPNPMKIVSDQDWEIIKTLYCAGEGAAALAERYGIQPSTIHSRASKLRWPTQNRIARADLSVATSDPAAALAALWTQRKEETRDALYTNSKKALERFFAHSPVPQSFAEAAIAEKMLAKAIDPDAGKERGPSNTNVSFLIGDVTPQYIDV